MHSCRALCLAKPPFSTLCHLSSSSNSTASPLNVAALLKKPSWSISTLLPSPSPTSSSSSSSSSSSTSSPSKMTPSDLQHLSTLSALPFPKHPEASLEALHSHLHFVSAVRDAPTAGVQPLQSLRDKTAQGQKEAEFGMEALRAVLEAEEEVVGKFHPRIRRKRALKDRGRGLGMEEQWDVLGLAKRKVGRYFAVERVKDREEGGGREKEGREDEGESEGKGAI